MSEQAVSSQELDNRKYIGPNKTGDNIDAERAANYGVKTDNTWGRVPLPLIDAAFDYTGFSNPDANGNYQTVIFNQGGSGGITVRTLTFSFDGSNNITSITRT